MHARADRAELDDRAIILDEARVRGPAARSKLRAAAGHLLDGARDKPDQRASRVRNTSADGRLRTSGQRIGCLPTSAASAAAAKPRFDLRLQARARPAIVVAAVETRRGLRRNDVPGRIADIDADDLERRWPEMLGAGIERPGLQRMQELRQSADGIVGEFRIGGVALRALDDQRGRKSSRGGRS